jgi:hypothetical protein
MHRRTILVTCLLVALTSLLLNRSSAAASTTSPEAALNPSANLLGWQKITIDSGPNVGQSLSLAIHPLTQKPYISYYDGNSQDLKLAFPVSSGGDCGPGNTWSCNSLKYTNTDNFGGFSSIDFNSAGNWGIGYASFYPISSLSFHGTTNPGNTSLYSSVQNTAYISYFGTSFRYNPDGLGGMAYLGYDGVHSKIFLNFASYHALTTSATCGQPSHWDCEVIAQAATAGLSGSPSLVYWGRIPMIAYRDSQYGRLFYAARAGLGTGNCAFSNQWTCNEVDHNSTVAGGVSFTFDQYHGAIAYYDSNTHYMIVATDAPGVCDWTCTYIEDVGAQTNGNHEIAIAVRNGKYLVAYTYRKSPSNTILKVAYPDPNGNCGPIDAGKKTWRCEVVDDGGGTKNVGNFISMGVTPSNVVYIAYSNDTDGTLKLAYQYTSLFMPVARK